MTQPPSATSQAATSQGFPELPITAADLTAARAGVTLRGGRLMGALGLLAAFSALGGALGAWALWLGARSLPGWIERLNGIQNSDLPQLDPTVLPAWVLPTLLGLSLLATALYVWSILAARQAVGAVRDQALRPDAEHAEALERSARTVRPWIRLGQIAPILNLILPLLIGAMGFGLIRQLAPQDMTGFGLGPLEMGAFVLSAVVQSLPTIIITWLILAAIRRWLDAVVMRARRPVPVRPAARSVEPWLLFTLILLCLGLASLLLGGLPLLAGSAFVGATPPNDPDLIALGITPALLRGALLLGGAAMLAGAFVYLLMALLMAWSRGFAANVATVLDAGLPGSVAGTVGAGTVTGAASASDPWSGPVQTAQRKEPY